MFSHILFNVMIFSKKNDIEREFSKFSLQENIFCNL